MKVTKSGLDTMAGPAGWFTGNVRELGGVLGIAVLASVFSAHGSYAAPASFAAGLTAALPVGAAFLAVGAVIALFVPRPAPGGDGGRRDGADRPAATDPGSRPGQ